MVHPPQLLEVCLCWQPVCIDAPGVGILVQELHRIPPFDLAVDATNVVGGGKGVCRVTHDAVDVEGDAPRGRLVAKAREHRVEIVTEI